MRSWLCFYCCFVCCCIHTFSFFVFTVSFFNLCFVFPRVLFARSSCYSPFPKQLVCIHTFIDAFTVSIKEYKYVSTFNMTISWTVPPDDCKHETLSRGNKVMKEKNLFVVSIPCIFLCSNPFSPTMSLSCSIILCSVIFVILFEHVKDTRIIASSMTDMTLL